MSGIWCLNNHKNCWISSLQGFTFTFLSLYFSKGKLFVRWVRKIPLLSLFDFNRMKLEEIAFDNRYSFNLLHYYYHSFLSLLGNTTFLSRCCLNKALRWTVDLPNIRPHTFCKVLTWNFQYLKTCHMFRKQFTGIARQNTKLDRDLFIFIFS